LLGISEENSGKPAYLVQHVAKNLSKEKILGTRVKNNLTASVNECAVRLISIAGRASE